MIQSKHLKQNGWRCANTPAMTPERQVPMPSQSTTSRNENWKPVVGCPDYEVSDQGNVRSYLKMGNHKDRYSDQPRLLKFQTHKDGYKTISLPVTTGQYTIALVHRLVMEAFVGPCPDGYEVGHVNGDPGDNRLENLKYVTPRENAAHRDIHGTATSGERNGQARLTEWQVAEIRYLAQKGVPSGKLAALFDVHRGHVNLILQGKKWRNVPARTDVDTLLDELAAARKENERYREAASEWIGWESHRYECRTCRSADKVRYCVEGKQLWTNAMRVVAAAITIPTLHSATEDADDRTT